MARISIDRPAVQTRGLTKRYGPRTVVDRLDIDVPAGVVAGFIGPNGAGKTTTLRMLLGLVRPDAGTGSVGGVALTEPAAYLPRVGALIESRERHRPLLPRARRGAGVQRGGAHGRVRHVRPTRREHLTRRDVST